MKQISFSLTTPQFLDGSKDVTRRLGWKSVKAGEVLIAVRKAQGLKAGEKVERLGLIRVVSTGREELRLISPAEVTREGFPGLPPRKFVAMFCEHMGPDVTPSTVVTRIEFVKLRPSETLEGLALVVRDARRLQVRMFAGERTPELLAELREAEAVVAEAVETAAFADGALGGLARRVADMFHHHRRFLAGGRSPELIASSRALELLVDKLASTSSNRQARLFNT